MTRFAIALLALAAVSTRASAQGQPDVCTRPDSVAVRGNARISEASVRADAGLARGDTINYRSVQTAIKTLFGTGQFSDVRITCEPDVAASRTVLVIHVTERPILGDVTVTGTNALSDRSVRERVDILIGRPIDPAQVANIIQRIDSLYESEGYYLARVRAETTVVNNVYKLVFNVDEGRRLAIAGVEVAGNRRVSDGDVVDAMKTRPEGFWWFRRGEFDEDKYAADLGEHIPKLYMSRGYVDFQLLHDTLVIDRSRGKALVRLEVEEGKRYRVGAFEVVGNRRFSTDEIKRFFPFTSRDPSITERVRGLVGGGNGDRQYFDQNEWEEATNRLRTAYSNEGYISVAVRPIVERVEVDSVPVVNLRWDIEERTPSTINRIDIVGNDYTTEACIRDQLVILPGDVFNQDRLVRSWQSLANLGFFETPITPPDVRPANEKGDVDIIFRVKEKKTGNVNFGASVGQGTGIGGFLGLDQPNVLGQCKRVTLQWQFGRYINDFNLSFTDPSIRQSRISGVASAYHTRSRFIVADLGRSTRTGGSLQLGFPLPRTRFTRLYVSYGGEAVQYSGGLFARDTSALRCNNCFRSTLGLTETRDTRIDLPFATAGMLQTVGAQFNGGPLGGTANFQRYTTELRAYAPLGQIGGTKPGSQPTKFVLGLTTRAGAVFGDAGPFFVSQKFALGGTQFGEMLRGYEEFSIAPQGFVFGTSTTQARRESFGNAFFTTTAEVGLRLNQQFYANVFFDAGNIWSRPREFDPTRLFRGAGVGIALITPLGPLGLDYAYGFDRLNSFGRPDPKWQLHFRLGNLF